MTALSGSQSKPPALPEVGDYNLLHLNSSIEASKIGVSKNAVLRLFFLHSFWIHHEKTVNILVHCWDHENKP